MRRARIPACHYYYYAKQYSWLEVATTAPLCVIPDTAGNNSARETVAGERGIRRGLMATLPAIRFLYVIAVVPCSSPSAPTDDPSQRLCTRWEADGFIK